MRRLTHNIELRNDVQWNSCKTLLLNIQTFASPRFLCCRCLKPKKKQALRVKGFKHILEEVSIVKILKQLRTLKGAIKEEKSH